MREKDEAAADAGADASGGAAAAEQPADAGASMAPDVSAVGPADGGGGIDESSLYDGSGRLVVNLEMFRDDNFVQVGTGPLHRVTEPAPVPRLRCSSNMLLLAPSLSPRAAVALGSGSPRFRFHQQRAVSELCGALSSRTSILLENRP